MPNFPGGEQCEQLNTDYTMDQVKRRSADMMAVLETSYYAD